MIATCGHSVREIRDSVEIDIMDFVIDYDTEIGGIIRAVSHMTCCLSCSERYVSLGVVLKTEADRQNWISGKTMYPSA